MICGDCAIAGSFNQKGLWYQEHDRPKEAEKAFQEARYLHETCMNPASCTCQHSVGMKLLRP